MSPIPKTSANTNMYMVTPDQIRGVLQGQDVPAEFAALPEATLRAGVFLAAIAVSRGAAMYTTPFAVMYDAMPIINQALGAETPTL